MSATIDARSGFARTLLFGAVAALGVPAVRLLVAPVLGSGLAFSLYWVGLAIAYLFWIAGSLRRGVGAAALASAGGLVLLAIAPGASFAAAGATLLVAAIRSGFLYRAPQPRLVVLEALLLVGGLLVAELLAAPGVLGLALAVWGYFLVQSLYFLLARPRPRSAAEPGDPFERARERLECLLDEVEGGRA
jgi:hypothetical protein